MDNAVAALLIRQIEALRQELKAQTIISAQSADSWTPDVKQAVDLSDTIAKGVELDMPKVTHPRYITVPANGPVKQTLTKPPWLLTADNEGDKAALDDKLPNWHPPKVMS